MSTLTAVGESRLRFWQRVREFAVPPSMIESATARRTVGDWAGACAAARIDVDLNLRFVASAFGAELAARIRADLRHVAPDLLRWHLPRVAPDGLLRPGLTISLASYQVAGSPKRRAVHLVARTPPAWAAGGQRISLAIWQGRHSVDGAHRHPHPRPDRRFRLDLHRHLWDARRAGELWERAGGSAPAPVDAEGLVPHDLGCAVNRWASEAAILLRSQGLRGGTVAVRLAARRRLALHVDEHIDPPRTLTMRITAASAKHDASTWLELPDAATWVLPDLALLRHGLIEPDQLHPLVAAALVPDRPASRPAGPHEATNRGGPRIVECRGAEHRIGVRDGVLVPLAHDPDELRREALLTALGGPPLPCLRVIEDALRLPDCLDDTRARLDHGDAAGAFAAIEDLLGPTALLPDGALRDELELAAQRQVAHGLYRAGLARSGLNRGARGRERREPRRRRRHGSSR